MWVEPNTNIKLLHNVPIDNTYENTIYFDNSTAQYNYFASLVKVNLVNYTYQRVHRGVARVGINAERIYDCNYMMFQNSAYGNKWFYAFINGVEYVNDNMSEVYFEIDKMQTWFFDYEIMDCYVEREHSVTDNIGDNIIPEPVEIGEYVLNGSYGTLSNRFNDGSKIALIYDDPDDTNTTLNDGIFGAGEIHIWDTTVTDIADLQNFINQQAQHPESIIGIYMIPYFVAENKSGGDTLEYGATGISFEVLKDTLDGTEKLNGYTPKNKKLYTYPYNCYLVHNNTGQMAIYRYEFFEKNNEGKYQPKFRVTGNVNAPVTVTCVPLRYKGAPSHDDPSRDVAYIPEELTISGYPMCSWSQDTFKAWWAQNSVPMIIKGGLSLMP